MSREEIYNDIEEHLGLVPSFMKSLPDVTLEHEWELFKATELNETLIPNKYKELIGVSVSAAIRCRYCSLAHTEMAKLNGASEEEIAEAVHFAKHTQGWSTYVNGLQIDYEQFKDEFGQIAEFAKKRMAEQAKQPREPVKGVRAA